MRRGLLRPGQLASLGSHLHEVGAIPSPTAAAAAGGVAQQPGRVAGDPALVEQLRAAGVGLLASHMLGVPRVRLLQDAVLLKARRSTGRVEWHRDYTYLGYLAPAHIVSVRLALTASVGSGALSVLSGSHRWDHDQAFDGFSDAITAGALDALPEPWRSHAQTARTVLELEPGDASVHHCLTWHGSFENRSDADQTVLVLHVMDADCVVRPQRLPAAHRHLFTTDAAGHLIGPSFPELT